MTMQAPARSSGDRRRVKGLRPRGTGGIVALASGVWRVDIEISRDPLTGRRRRVSRRVRGTRDDAEAVLARLRVADHAGRLPRPGTTASTMRSALDDYVAAARAGTVELAPKTVVTTRSAAVTMAAVELPDGRTFGDIALSKLGWDDIELLYQTMRRAGLSAATVRRKATVLARALDRARKHGRLDHNPAHDAARPKTIRTKPHSPSAAEVDDAIAAAARTDVEISDAALILVSTGVRMGELLGLKWAEVDLLGEFIVVCWSITDGGPGVGVLRKPTKRSDWRERAPHDLGQGGARPTSATCRGALRWRTGSSALRASGFVRPGHPAAPGHLR